MQLRRSLAVVLLATAVGLLPGSAPAEDYDPLFDDEYLAGDALEHDPLESGNRVIFGFNQQLDDWLLDPVTRAYQWAVPHPVREAVHHFFLNLRSPVVFANEVVQLRPEAAATTFGRFLANSTWGVAGLFDVAESHMDIPRGDADFGQTLARYGVPRGPYVVLPLLGPSTTRDALGRAVDVAIDPVTYLVGPVNLEWQLVRGGSFGLAVRDSHLDSLDALRDSSVDYYSAMRSAYLQSRQAMEEEASWGAPAAASAEARSRSAEGQDSVPEASFSMRSSMAAISASKSSRLTMPENSLRRSASSLTVPSR